MGLTGSGLMRGSGLYNALGRAAFDTSHSSSLSARSFALPLAENGGAWSRRSPFPLRAGMEAHILCEEIPHLG